MFHIDNIDKLIIREIQQDIPLSLDPYGDIAKRIGCSKAEVLQRVRRMKEEGFLKRIAGILRHCNSGYTVNGMLVCYVNEEKLEEAGERLSQLKQVSHCYQRKAYIDWSYNLYAMIHAKAKRDVEDIVENFISTIEVDSYKILYSIEELKKTSITFYD